jgi:hypothetical protein
MLTRDDILKVYAAGPGAVVALVEQLQATQAELRQQVQLLTARVADLEARLNKDSHNSLAVSAGPTSSAASAATFPPCANRVRPSWPRSAAFLPVKSSCLA